jgi:cation diffusion facilitator CzcD-associated flavoprotein CzcO
MNGRILDVAIIGSGFGGIAMARALQRAGRGEFVIFEKAEAIGGTWRDNTYPGAACDVPSHLYSLSDAPNPEWTRLFPAQPEIRAYLEMLAAPLMAAGRLVTGFRLARATWRAGDGAWEIRSAAGDRVRARSLVLALGGLHQPAWPQIDGQQDFRGASFHTARWRHDVALDGKRVAVIGSGASAVQVVPAVIDRVAQLHVFQRTPSWLMPRSDVAIPSWLRAVFRRLPITAKLLRGAIFLWLEALAIGLLRPRAAFWARALARRHLRRQIADPALRAMLTPDYPIGCKRVLVSSDFYPALLRPNCTLTDIPIARIEADGVRLADGRLIAVDVIVYATGFRPLDVLRDVVIEGHRLADDWRDRPTAHLGIGAHGHPNLFFLLGPNTALGHNSVLTMIESQVRHVIAAMAARDARGAAGIEPTRAAQSGFIAALDRRFSATAWNGGCRSWYLDGRGRNIALWVGTVLAYRRLTRRPIGEDYLFT